MTPAVVMPRYLVRRLVTSDARLALHLTVRVYQTPVQTINVRGGHLRQCGRAKISPVRLYRSQHKRLRRSECPWLHILGFVTRGLQSLISAHRLD